MIADVFSQIALFIKSLWIDLLSIPLGLSIFTFGKLLISIFIMCVLVNYVVSIFFGGDEK